VLTFPLAVIAALTFIACLRYHPDGRRRRDLALLSPCCPVAWSRRRWRAASWCSPG